MKRIAFVLLGAVIALGFAACNNQGEEEKPESKTDSTDSPYKPPEQDTGKKAEIGQKCTKKGYTNPCVNGASCVEDLTSGISICMKDCEEDKDCASNQVCGDDFEIYPNVCVEKTPPYGLSWIGLAAGCDKKSWPSGAWNGWYAEDFYSDAGKDDIAYALGICVPLCDNGGANIEVYDTCPAVALDTSDNATYATYDWFELSGKTPTCTKGLISANTDVGLCSFPVAENEFCDGYGQLCTKVYGRKAIQYDTNGQFIKGQDLNGVAVCSPAGVGLASPQLYDEETGLYSGFDETANLWYSCEILCDDNDGCKCADQNDPNCKLEANQVRICQKAVSPDDTESYYGGSCSNLVKCNTAADCPAKTYQNINLVATCFDPAQNPIVNKENGHTYSWVFTEKVCQYEFPEE